MSKSLFLKDKDKIKIKLKQITILKDYFLAFAKVVFGVISHSSFMLFNALYSIFLGISRHICIKNRNKDYKKQYRYYVIVSILLALAGIVYTVYNSINLLSENNTEYHLYISIGIAAFTFFEFGLRIFELFKIKKTNNFCYKALAYIDFASVCALFVLTQVVLTSLYPEEDFSLWNSLSAIGFGLIIMHTGIIMFIKRRKSKITVSVKIMTDL